MCKCKTKCNCNITQITKGEKGDPSSEATLGYKVYVALLAQSSTNAPVARVLQNTLSGVPVWSYSGVGIYILTLTGEFTVDKTTVMVGQENQTNINIFGPNDVNSIFLESITPAGVHQNGQLFNTMIEIRVYN